MAETVQQLKQDKTSAKSAFTKQANYLSKYMSSMMKQELQEEFSKLKSLARRVDDANEDYRAGLLADFGAEEEAREDVKLDPRQPADLGKTEAECGERLDEVRNAVQDALWAQYGEVELGARFREAEAACERAQKSPYSEHLAQITRLIQEARASLADWEAWIPRQQSAELKNKVVTLTSVSNNLEARMAEALGAQRSAVRGTSGGESRPVEVPQALVPRPGEAAEPARLPRFTGAKRDFYRWWKDWERLQKEGEPSGSAGLKKFQLLNSVDKKICRDLHLPAYNGTDDIFRVLQSKYGNKTEIALEIIDGLKKWPPLKLCQPKEVMDLIQTIEKVLQDLTELGSPEIVKHTLVTTTVESKLPDDVQRRWLKFVLKPANRVTPENHLESLLRYLKREERILERLEQLHHCEGDKAPVGSEDELASTSAANTDGCVMCGDEKHRGKIFFCKQFKELEPGERRKAAKKLGACRRCLMCHAHIDDCKDTFLCSNAVCAKGGSSDHNFLLCTRGGSKGKRTQECGEIQHRKPNVDGGARESTVQRQAASAGQAHGPGQPASPGQVFFVPTQMRRQ